MNNSWISTIVVIAISFLSSGSALSEDFSLDKYSCGIFINDMQQAESSTQFMRGSMMIAWATGYASAFQSKSVRGDGKALQLLAAMLGDICRNNPDKLIMPMFVLNINEQLNGKDNIK